MENMEKSIVEIKKLIGCSRNEQGIEDYIIKMKEKGFDIVKPTINKELRNIDKAPGHSLLTEEQVKFMLMLELQPETLDSVWNDNMFQNEFLVQVFNGRINAFGLEEFVDPKLFVYGILVFGVDSPGKGNIFLIKLLEHYHKNNVPATKNDLIMNIFPEGFYDDVTGRNIVDYCLKSRATVFSELY
jgi:hypothetical protein